MKGLFAYVFAGMALLCALTGIAAASIVTQNITYQGRLTDAGGNPLTGPYSLTFKLYDVESGGVALQTDTHSVTVSNGLFTTPVQFNQSFFDGGGLWLGITVSGDSEMTPRQEFRPVPYALSLIPGAKIFGSFPGYVLNISNNGPGIRVNTSATTSPGIYVSTSGLTSNGLFLTTTGLGSGGVVVDTWGDDSTGLYAYTSGDSSKGVVGYTIGSNSPGVKAYTTGSNSPGIYGESAQDVGVYGKGKEGGYFTTNQAGAPSNWFPGVNVSTRYNYNPGLSVKTTGSNSPSVRAETMNIDSPGVYSTTTGNTSAGVIAVTNGSFSDGVSGRAYGINSNGVVAYSEQSPAIWAKTNRSDDKYGLQTPDIIRALNYETGSSDAAEYMPVIGDVPPGTVLVIGSDGKLQPSTTAYDTGVAGIVSTAPGISLGAKEGGNPGEALIAVAGRVPCKVDATNGPIHPRDLLTTSGKPGYAMKAEPIEINGRTFYPSGIVLGKALGTLESGTGTIDVIVTLQ